MVMVQYFDEQGLLGTHVYPDAGFAKFDAQRAVENADFNARCHGFGAAVITSTGHQFISSDRNDRNFLKFWNWD